ncbi:MAG: hypothetical protein P8Y80_06375 [Acidobacteriota bacterium]|jgi:hypothetical protein
MKLPFCPYEEKVTELLRRNSWPESADPKLAAHAETCSRCSDVILTNRIFKQGHSERMLMAHTESPHYLWWKAQLRRRHSTVETITKPLAFAEKLAFVCLLCFVAGIVFWQWQPLGQWISRLSDHLETGAFWNAAWIQLTTGRNLIGYSILAGIAAFVCIGGWTLLTTRHKE